MSDLSSLKAQIKSGKLNDYYIFTGPEIGVMQIYIKQIAKTLNADIKNLDCITDLAKKLTNRSMLKNACIYTLRDSKEFIFDENINNAITQNIALFDMPVIFIYTSLDKRSKVYKNCQDKIVEFEHLSDNVLVKYIQKEIDLNFANCMKLIEVCESDYSRIMLEIDKIKQFALYYHGPEVAAYNESFETLLKSGVIYQPPRDAVFMFVDAVLRYKPKLAFELLEESYASGEATMVLLSNLYNSAKQLLQVQSYEGSGKITEATGLTPFQVKLASGRRNFYSNGELVYLMRLVRNAEKGIKTGEIEEMMSVPYVLVNLWQR